MKISREKNKDGGWEWKVDVTIASTRIRESGFKTKGKLEEFVDDIKLRARQRRYGLKRDPVGITIEDLVTAHKKTLLRRGDRNDLRAIKILEAFGKQTAGMLVQEIGKSDLRSFASSLRGDNSDLKPETINRYLTYVAAAFTAAPNYFAELEREDWQPPRFPWEKTSKRGRERTITREESATLLTELRNPRNQKYNNRRHKPEILAARRDVADAFEIGLNTAMRPGEVRTLAWSQVDLEACELHLPKTKNGDPRDIPMNRRVVEILRARADHRLAPFIFPNRDRTGPRDVISKVLRPLAKSLGLEYGQELPNGFTPHSQRHTATTEMLRRGHDLATVKSITGHSDDTMALRYAHATHASRRRAIEDLAGASDGENTAEKSAVETSRSAKSNDM